MKESEKHKIKELTKSIVGFCSSDIMRHSMQSFMEIQDVELRWNIALSIANAGHSQAIKDMNLYFTKEYEKENKNLATNTK